MHRLPAQLEAPQQVWQLPSGLPVRERGKPMITIHVRPAKRRFSRRKQWKFAIVAGNNEQIDPRDMYANVADIQSIWSRIVGGNEAIKMVVHYQAGEQITWLRRLHVVGGTQHTVLADTLTARSELERRLHQEQQRNTKGPQR